MSDEEVTERCIRLRKAWGYDYNGGQKAFAENHLGVSAHRWGNVERGYPLSKQLTLLLVKKCPGVDMMWLWYGKIGGLSVRMFKALGEPMSPGKDCQ